MRTVARRTAGATRAARRVPPLPPPRCWRCLASPSRARSWRAPPLVSLAFWDFVTLFDAPRAPLTFSDGICGAAVPRVGVPAAPGARLGADDDVLAATVLAAARRAVPRERTPDRSACGRVSPGTTEAGLPEPLEPAPAAQRAAWPRSAPTSSPVRGAAQTCAAGGDGRCPIALLCSRLEPGQPPDGALAGAAAAVAALLPVAAVAEGLGALAAFGGSCGPWHDCCAMPPRSRRVRVAAGLATDATALGAFLATLLVRIRPARVADVLLRHTSPSSTTAWPAAVLPFRCSGEPPALSEPTPWHRQRIRLAGRGRRRHARRT